MNKYRNVQNFEFCKKKKPIHVFFLIFYAVIFYCRVFFMTASADMIIYVQ